MNMQRESIMRISREEIETMIERKYNVTIKKISLSHHGAKIIIEEK